MDINIILILTHLVKHGIIKYYRVDKRGIHVYIENNRRN